MSMVVTIAVSSFRMAVVGLTAAATHLHLKVTNELTKPSLFLGLHATALCIL